MIPCPPCASGTRRRFLLPGILIFCLLLPGAGPAAAGPHPSLEEDDPFAEYEDNRVPDPLEGWNRAVQSFNDVAIDYVLRPLHRGYVAITPDPVRTGLHNVFYNLLFPVRFVNNLLQGKGLAAGAEFSWFILNSTAGLGGIFDLAPSHPAIVPVEEEDLGQTLAVWGMKETLYIVWPFLGPSTLKDSLGMVGDTFLDPLAYMDPWIGFGLTAVKTFNDLDKILDIYDDMRGTAVEPYSAVRNGYIQYRRGKAAR
ncbi:MAG: VacJ family lipoprotein [Desulfovibrio sp.]|nr:VacJ family lipoprotein [Desulfovibrio sp.]